MVPWTDPALEIRLRRQAVQTAWWGWGGGRWGVGEVGGTEEPADSWEESLLPPTATCPIYACVHARQECAWGVSVDSEGSEPQLPTGTGEHVLGREGV